MFTKRHPNASQQVPVVSFKPLLGTEGPYYKNINRGAKSAYEYADLINKIFSFSGSIALSAPRLGDASDYALYEMVKLNDDETFSKTTVSDSVNSRIGMICAMLSDEQGLVKYVLCLFCANFVFPSNYTVPGNIGDALYYSSSTSLSLTAGTDPTTISYRPLARKTGPYSICFSGIIGLLS